MLLCNILRVHDETPFNYYPKQTPASVLNDRHIGNLEHYRLTEGIFWFPRQPGQEKKVGAFFQNKRWYPEKNSKTEEKTWDEKQLGTLRGLSIPTQDHTLFLHYSNRTEQLPPGV